MNNRATFRRRIITGLTACVLLALLLFWAWHSVYKPAQALDTSIDRPTDPSLAAGRTPVHIRGAVLYDCYEHYRENVPPRNDTKARANHWQPPPMPADIIRAAAAEKPNPADAQLLEFLKDWESGYRGGRHLLATDWSRLAGLVENSHLSFQTLFDLGVAAGFLENISVAAIFHRAALRRASEEYKNLSPLHPAAPMLRVALPQMGMYWTLGDYPLVEQRFRIEMQLYPPLSQEGRKCAHSCAEAMYYQGRPKEPGDLIADVMQRHEQAGDLTASDKQEIGWIVGIFYGPDRNKEAIAGLAVAAKSGGNRAVSALQLMASKIANLPPDEMEAELDSLNKYKLTQEQVQRVFAYVDERKARMVARQATTRPTTRAALTSQQMALLALRASAASSRPTTRSAITSAQQEAALQERQRQYQQMLMEQQRTAAASTAEKLIPELRALLKTNPRQTIDRLLNKGEMQILMQAQRYDEVDELGNAAIIAAARDTWQVEQLQRFRVSAFAASGKSKEAISAARALFNVAGLGSVQYDVSNIVTRLPAAYPSDPTIANRFRLQQLAAAQLDADRRQKAMSELGENVMAAIPVDPAPFAQAIKDRQSATDYDTLYGVGNLLLISGRITEARETFEKVYKIAPPGELKYVSEALAKMIKAEDGGIGRANEFTAAIRPKE